MPAGSRANREAQEANRSSSKGSVSKSYEEADRGSPRDPREKGKWTGITISNRPGTPSHRAWTFLNTGVDPGLGKESDKKNNIELSGRGGSDDSGSEYCAEETPELKIEKQPEEKSIKKLFPDFWKLFVNESEWDLSDVINIDRPCRDYCYWILTHKNGKKTRISGNVILEEI